MGCYLLLQQLLLLQQELLQQLLLLQQELLQQLLLLQQELLQQLFFFSRSFFSNYFFFSRSFFSNYFFFSRSFFSNYFLLQQTLAILRYFYFLCQIRSLYLPKKCYRISLDSHSSKSFFCFFDNFTLFIKSGLLKCV